MRPRVRLLAAIVIWVAAAAFLAGAQRSARAAGPLFVPLASPAPGSPVFVSFRNSFDGNFTTQMIITATGSDLAYVWSLQNVACGSLVAPQARGASNGYAHRECPTAQEIPVRVIVLVARAADLNTDGTPKNDDVPRFIYTQVARAQDSVDTQNVQPAATLQYFGPAPAAAASPGSTPVAGSAPIAQETEAVGVDWLGPGGALLIFLLVVALGERNLSTDECDRFKKLCAEARSAAARRERAARDAHARAAAARSKCNDANREADRLRRVAEDADKPPSEGSSWMEDARTGRRVTSRDLGLEGEADKAAYGSYKKGDINADQLQQEWGKSGTPEQQQELRKKDDAARAARRKAAHDASDAARAKADAACKDAEQAELDAKQEDAIADAAEKQADQICEMVARLCPEVAVDKGAAAPTSTAPVAPSPPTPTQPTPPSGPSMPVPPEEPGPPIASHQAKLEAHMCCESGEYYGIVFSMEQSSLPILTKLFSWFKGEWKDTGWFTTGYDYWSGSVYCSSDSGKFATFEAKAPRTGLSLGGGLGATYIHCTGRNHPQEVIDEIPNMMSGFSGDIAGTAGLAAAAHVAARGAQAAGRLAKVAKWIDKLHPLDAAAKGTGIAAFQSMISSQVQGAERCVTATFDATMQAGAWHVSSAEVFVLCKDYGCCFQCSKYVDRDE